jgi:hypothetical protein
VFSKKNRIILEKTVFLSYVGAIVGKDEMLSQNAYVEKKFTTFAP